MDVSVTSVSTVDNAQSSNAVTSPSFTPAVNDVLVALVVSEDSSCTISAVSGGSLTWTKRVESTVGSNTYASIWTAVASSASSMTVATSAFGGAGARQMRVLMRELEQVGYDGPTCRAVVAEQHFGGAQM